MVVEIPDFKNKLQVRVHYDFSNYRSYMKEGQKSGRGCRRLKKIWRTNFEKIGKTFLGEFAWIILSIKLEISRTLNSWHNWDIGHEGVRF